jgi:hypothetical protein
MSTPLFGAAVDFIPVQNKIATSLIRYRLLDFGKSLSSFSTNSSTASTSRCSDSE